MLLKLRFFLTLPLLLLTLAFTPKAKSTDSALLVGQNVFVLEQAFVMGQGITTDGEYYYTSGAITALNMTALAKWTFENPTLVQKRINPLPEVCAARGNNHIGGISCYHGKIYASVEGGDVCRACVAVFDCETLEPTGEVYDLPNDAFDDGVPWLAVDGETGLLYASKWDHAKTLFVYDVNDGMRPVREIALTGLGELHRIQGGEFYEGQLYLSNDCKDTGGVKRILTVDLENGAVSVLAERDVGTDNCEAEGMTAYPAADGSFLHVLDYNKAVGVFWRHYALSEKE